MAGLTISDAAAMQINHLKLNEKNDALFLRITVDGGGCSGFQYDIKLDDTPQENDISFTHQGATVMVDAVSLGFIDGSEVDYVEDLSASQFVITNPNAASKCGCGNSFSI
ncbi:MAG TPA: iron-sulfur cluster insertion protein ErpA [Holosporales bacterium]|nr:iron-sulfur cluster insertion protein ErpA [Holosporales bacterium]